MEVFRCFEVPHFKTPNGCNHNQMSQGWQRTQGLQSFFFWVIFIFLYKGFLGWNILQYVTKNTYNLSVHHIFCINFWWILIKNFQKVYIFYQILCLILKNYPNFRLSESMLIIFNFWWILIKNFQKVYIFYQILCLILKNYPNFRLYESMLIILWFVFLYHKIQLCFTCHVHYTLFICRKGLLKYFNCVQ